MKKDITKMVHKGSTVLSFFFVGSGSVMLIVLSRVFHQETDKLHELNDIFQNPKARVVIGKDHGTQVIKKMKKIVHKNKLLKEVEPAKKKKKIVRANRPKKIKIDEKQNEIEPMTNNSFNYSLYDGNTEDQNSQTVYPRIQKAEIEMQPMIRNQQKIQYQHCQPCPEMT